MLWLLYAFYFQSEYFETLSKPPSISKIIAREVLDSKGQPTVQTDIYCIVKGLEKVNEIAIFKNDFDYFYGDVVVIKRQLYNKK